MSAPQGNRRRVRRRSPKKAVKLRCQKGTWGMGADVARALLDVSTDGARLVVSAPLADGQEVLLSLEGPWHKRPVNVRGRVRWCAALADGGHCVGVHFEKTLPYGEVEDLASAAVG